MVIPPISITLRIPASNAVMHGRIFSRMIIPFLKVSGHRSMPIYIHLNFLELLAIQHTLTMLTTLCSIRKNMHIRTISRTIVPHYISYADVYRYIISFEIWSWCFERNIWLFVSSHMAGITNIESDMLLRRYINKELQ